MKNCKSNSSPLVSIVVLTYNSAGTVRETLDSIRLQTYENIELIISDDCSKDNTLKKCEEWIEKYSRRFNGTKIVTTNKNAGTAANMNRADNACSSDWVKPIAGDDILESTCIEDYVNFVSVNKDVVFLFGKVILFGDNAYVKDRLSHTFDYSFFDMTRGEQLIYLLEKGNCLPAPSLFYNLKKRRALNLLWDERIPLIEDYPMWINSVMAGVKLFFLNKNTVRYRVGGRGVTSGFMVDSSPLYLISKRRLNILYLFAFRYKRNPEDGLSFITNYVETIDETYQNSYEYRLGKLILKPVKKMLFFLFKLKSFKM